VLEFAQSGDCRMARLVRYFGDTRDARPCGRATPAPRTPPWAAASAPRRGAS
jgi:superfamily II DNA helicase RecQ